MHKLTKEELPAIAPLFEGVQETMVWSCLQGLMGEAYAAEETRGGSSASSDTPLRRSHRPSIGRIWPGWPPFRQDTRSFPSAGSCMNS